MAPRSHERLIRNLIEVGSITPGQVAAGLAVIDTSRPGRVRIVRASDGMALVVKQAADAVDQERLAHEVAIYSLLRAAGQPFVPSILTYDDSRGLLVMAHVNGMSLTEMIDRPGRNQRPVAARLGEMLAGLHRTAMGEAGQLLVNANPPLVLSIHLPDLGWFTRSSESSLRMRASIQHEREFVLALDALRAAWRSDTFIHADLKLEHVLVSEGFRVTIIDWESAQRGDAAWDIGSIFAGLLLRWLRSIPLIAGLEPGDLVDQATVPFHRIQQMADAFWRAYIGAASLDDRARCNLLLRAVQAAAAILIQREEEYLQSAYASTGRTSMILSVSSTILGHPLDSARVLFGIESDSWRR